MDNPPTYHVPIDMYREDAEKRAQELETPSATLSDRYTQWEMYSTTSKRDSDIVRQMATAAPSEGWESEPSMHARVEKTFTRKEAMAKCSSLISDMQMSHPAVSTPSFTDRVLTTFDDFTLKVLDQGMIKTLTTWLSYVKNKNPGEYHRLANVRFREKLLESDGTVTSITWVEKTTIPLPVGVNASPLGYTFKRLHRLADNLCEDCAKTSDALCECANGLALFVNDTEKRQKEQSALVKSALDEAEKVWNGGPPFRDNAVWARGFEEKWLALKKAIADSKTTIADGE